MEEFSSLSWRLFSQHLGILHRHEHLYLVLASLQHSPTDNSYDGSDIGLWQRRRHAQQMQEIERGLEELKEFEE